MFFLIAFGLEFIGVVITFFAKLKKSAIINLGIAMNARGSPGIVLTTTVFTYNIINVEFLLF